MRRFAPLAIVPLLVAAIVVGGANADPSAPSAETAAAKKGKVVKYEGTWRFAGSEPDETLPWKVSGRKTGPKTVSVKGSFLDSDLCPTKMTEDDLRGEGKGKRKGKRTWRSKGDKNAPGDYKLVLKTGRKAQRVEAKGVSPACNTDGFYSITGKFTGPKGGTGLGKRFEGTLRGNEDPPNRLKVVLRAKRVG
ncbi:hypothetical protein HJD18_12565 [Thermoleophilia bacterium SCSIO 60948]|nr:hypothetical protein HJD18_12565 [Thermoleophilia bacterium SCSIO 60948]